MPKVTAYLDCGCAILENGSRVRCPTCEAELEYSEAPLKAKDKYPEQPPELYPYPLIERPSSQSVIIEEILAERVRQDIKWGEQNHDPFTWLTILMEEVGETAKAALEYRFANAPDKWRQEYRDELVQVGAVAVAMLECLARDKWLWGEGVKR